MKEKGERGSLGMRRQKPLFQGLEKENGQTAEKPRTQKEDGKKSKKELCAKLQKATRNEEQQKMTTTSRERTLLCKRRSTKMGKKLSLKNAIFLDLKKKQTNSPLSEDVYPTVATSDGHPQMVVQKKELGDENGQSAIACGLET